MRREAAIAALEWQIAMGADEALGAEPLDRYALADARRKPAAAPPAGAAKTTASRPPAPPAPPAPDAPSLAAGAAAARGREAAGTARGLGTLRDILAEFDGIALKQTAMNLVFGDGNPDSGIMVIGEAPGAEEDRQGIPFVGPSGRLWEKMLAPIGLDRSGYYITNMIPWRPPGNRTPTEAEVAACLPFLHRHIELVKPRIVVVLGRSAAINLLGVKDSMARLRGRWRRLESPALDPPAAVLPTYHPAFLLRNPAQKKYAWRDVLALAAKRRELGL